MSKIIDGDVMPKYNSRSLSQEEINIQNVRRHESYIKDISSFTALGILSPAKLNNYNAMKL